MSYRSLAVAVVVLVGSWLQVAAGEPGFRAYVPDTVSVEAQEFLKTLKGPGDRPISPAPDDLPAWQKLNEVRKVILQPLAEVLIKRYGPTIVERKLGGVPVLDIRPRNWKDDGRVLLYTHGGAYTFFDARTTLPSSVTAANGTGLRVISIDYTLAPFAKWPKVTDEVVAVFAALAEEGIKPERTAIYGDSAGGGLAAGSILKLRDKGLAMPGAVVLWSPWADIGNRGDTAISLRDAEPTYLYDKHLKNSALAYADEKDHKHPYVSPVYGDFSKGFPPTLIQGGTREIFLSHFVRLYRAIDQAGGSATLDLYEGMTHVFQYRLADAPEGKASLSKMKRFLDKNLAK